MHRSLKLLCRYRYWSSASRIRVWLLLRGYKHCFVAGVAVLIVIYCWRQNSDGINQGARGNGQGAPEDGPDGGDDISAICLSRIRTTMEMGKRLYQLNDSAQNHLRHVIGSPKQIYRQDSLKRQPLALVISFPMVAMLGSFLNRERTPFPHHR